MTSSALRHPGKSRLEILAFHRILDACDSYFIPPMLFLRNHFERLINKLSIDSNILDLAEAVSHLKNRTLSKRSLAITFDDGYLDNYVLARDFLLPQGINATFFVPINQIDSAKPYWWDYLAYIIEHNKKAFSKWLHNASFSSQPRLKTIIELLSLDNSGAFSRQLVRFLNEASRIERSDFLGSIENEFGPYDGTRLLMNWSEIDELCAKGFSIGSHTLSHEPLTDLDHTEALAEISGSRNALNTRLKRPVFGFCYPRGAFSTSLSEAVQQAGYSYAVTTRYASNSPESNVFTLCRRNISEYEDLRSRFPIASIRLELSGLLDYILSSRR
jgi:peptidoglycan/xylan/chitin deacetylase (PgdA/CDA1 family)